MIEALFDGCADTARDRIDSAISARALAEFFESSGTEEVECDSKLSHDWTEEGTPRSFSSNFLMVTCLDVRIGAVVSGSSSVVSEDSLESEINPSLSPESTIGRIVAVTVGWWALSL